MSNQNIYLLQDNGMHTKDSDSYGTPPWLFSFLDKKYNFNLDVCASDLNHKCDKYFTINDNALKQDWAQYKTCFCNPPFSRGKKELFLKKAHEEMQKGTTTVFLIPADIINVYWRTLIFNIATKITIISERVKFILPHSDVESKSGLGIAIVEFSPHKPPSNHLHFLTQKQIKSDKKQNITYSQFLTAKQSGNISPLNSFF